MSKSRRVLFVCKGSVWVASSCFIKDLFSFCNCSSEKWIADGCQFYEIDRYFKELLKIFDKAEVVVSMLDRRHRLKLNDQIKIARRTIK